VSLLAQPLLWLALATTGAFFALSGPSGESPDVRARLLAVARPVLRWVVVIFAVLLAAPGMGEDFRAALIAALLVVAGWFVTFLFQQEERAADQIDLMLALRAEVWVFLNDLQRNVRNDPEARLAAELDATPDAAPFFPQPGPAIVFEANAAQIARLPHGTVDEVVQFYSVLAGVRQFAAELREPVFLSRPAVNRRLAYGQFLKNLVDLTVLADAAVAALNRALGEGFGADTDLNRTDPSRSDPAAAVSAASERIP
jgi:hypothetical protein